LTELLPGPAGLLRLATITPTFILPIPGGLDGAPRRSNDWKLTALPSIDEEQWVPMVQETDVLLVDGGDAL
jgi:hypothetical protein